MRKLTFLVIVILLLFSFRCHAATLYVRPQGGDYPLCDGSTNVDYADRAAGTDNCALSHPAWLLGAGSGSSFNSGRMSANDTGVIAPGEYLVGYSMPNASPYCSSAATNSCRLKAPPSGTGGNYTKVIGCSTSGCASEQDRPELYLVGEAQTMMSMDNTSYVEISDLEITDHYAGWCTPNTPLQLCGKRAFESTAGGWHHIKFTNLNIHGLADAPIKMASSDATSDVAITLTNVDARANGYDGIMFGNDTPTGGIEGTITFEDCDIEFNGCYENYPLTGVGDDLKDGFCRNTPPRNGDGVSASATGGKWIFINCNISHNTGDGLDLLYHCRGCADGVCTDTRDMNCLSAADSAIIIKGGVFEGNTGNQIKANRNVDIYSIVMTGNCYYFYPPVNVDGNGSGALEYCRATGETLIINGDNGTPGENPVIANSTLLGGANRLIANGPSVFLYNNILYGGYDFMSDPTYFSWGTGSALNLASMTKVYGDYNICYGEWNGGTPAFCSADHNVTADPEFTGTILQGPGSGVGYYWANDYKDQLLIGETSPARDMADETAQTVWKYDVNQVDRDPSWDIGAYEYESTSQDVCDSTHCNLCLTSGTCGDASCYWWTSDLACHGVAETCNNNCDLCAETPEACSASTKPCYWWDSSNTCEGIIEGCNDYCGDCLNETDCDGSDLGTCEWKRSTGVCGTEAETCAEHYSRCLSEATCEAQSHYWYNSQCNLNPEGWEQVIVWDTTSNGYVTNNNILTVPVNVGNNEYRLLLVGIGWEPSTSPASISSVTSNNISCTAVETQGFGSSQIFLETMEDQAYTGLTEQESGGTASIQTDNVYEGTYSSKHTAGAASYAYVRKSAVNLATVYSRFRLYLPADFALTSNGIDFFRMYDGYPSTLGILLIGLDGVIDFYNSPNATTYDTGYSMPLDQYVDFVVGYYVHDTAGWIKVWADGVLIESQTAIDTRKTVSSQVVGSLDYGITINDDEVEHTIYMDNISASTALDYDNYVSMYYCLPDIGNVNVVVTLNNSVSELNAGIISLAGTYQSISTSEEVSGTGTTPTDTITTVKDNSWIVDVVGNSAGYDATAGTGQTERYYSGQSMRLEGSTKPTTTAGSQTVTWTNTSDYWGIITAVVEPGEAYLPGEDTCYTVCSECSLPDDCGGSSAGCYWWGDACHATPQYTTGCTFTGVTLQ